MPKRIVDGDGLWRSSKLYKVDPPRYRAEFANLLPLALANGVFEADPHLVWAQVYAYNRVDITVDDVTAILAQFEKVKMLFRWEDADGKSWGYWIDIDKPGRLPPPSERNREKRGVEPPADKLREFLGVSYPAPRQELGDGSLGNGNGSGTGNGKCKGMGNANGTGAGSSTENITHYALPLTQPLNPPVEATATATTNSPSPSTHVSSPVPEKMSAFCPIQSTSSAPDLNVNAGEALSLARYFHGLVNKRDEVKVPPAWETLWKNDMAELLLMYSYDDCKTIINESQSERWKKFIVRAAGLLKCADEIFKNVKRAQKKNDDLPEYKKPQNSVVARRVANEFLNE